jgi:hypothetical protein
MSDKEIEIQNERYLASIANYFIQIGNEYIAKSLAQSSLQYWEREEQAIDPNTDHPFTYIAASGYIFYLTPHLYKDLEDRESGLGWELSQAIEGVMGKVKYQYKIQGVEYDINWRMRLIAEADTQEVTNQNNFSKDPILYQGMKFNSPPEIEVAKALDRKGVVYFPNCLVRVGTNDNRKSYYPDFLIHHLGKWGILEVDGQTYHTPQSATKDHARAQAIQMHAKVFFTRYDAQRCSKDSDGVVDDFLKLLALNG